VICPAVAENDTATAGTGVEVGRGVFVGVRVGVAVGGSGEGVKVAVAGGAQTLLKSTVGGCGALLGEPGPHVQPSTLPLLTI
jgi:hypothetical protein